MDERVNYWKGEHVLLAVKRTCYTPPRVKMFAFLPMQVERLTEVKQQLGMKPKRAYLYFHISKRACSVPLISTKGLRTKLILERKNKCN